MIIDAKDLAVTTQYILMYRDKHSGILSKTKPFQTLDDARKSARTRRKVTGVGVTIVKETIVRSFVEDVIYAKENVAWRRGRKKHAGRRFKDGKYIPVSNKHGKRPGIVDKLMSVYSADKTIKQMSEESGIEEPNIRVMLAGRNLPYKRAYARISLKDVYSPDKTVAQMIVESGKSERAVYQYLKRHNLPFKRIIGIKDKAT